MLLTRMGNKRKIVNHLKEVFPEHKLRIEPFFGAGGAYFYLPKPKYAVLNDLDGDVTNLYLQVIEKPQELSDAIASMPISQHLVTHWKNHQETDPLRRAVRFLLLSNFTYLGKGDTLRVSLGNEKQLLLDAIYPTLNALADARITGVDFREVMAQISFSNKLLKKDEAFMYLDPVYLDTEYSYQVPKWTKDDTHDCFEMMGCSGVRCAMSEFDHPFVLEQVKKRRLHVYEVGTRRNIKNRRRELVITNYPVSRQMGIHENLPLDPPPKGITPSTCGHSPSKGETCSAQGKNREND